MVETNAPIHTLILWAWRQARGSHLRICIACFLGIVRVAMALTFVWVSKALVDSATGDAPADRLVPLCIALGALMLSEMGISMAISYLSNQTEARMRNRIRAAIYSHVLGSKRAEYDRMHSGDLLNRLTEDVRVIVDVVCARLPQLVVLVVQLIGALVFLYFMSPVLALCILCILPFFLLLSKLYIKPMRTLTANIRKQESDIQSNMQEGIQHQTVLQTLESVGYMIGNLNGLQGSLYNQTMRRTRFSLFSRGMVNLGFIGGYLTAFIWSIWHLHTGVITYGTMTAFLQLVARIQNPMSSLTQQIPAFVHATSSIDRLIELEKIPSEEKGDDVMMQAPTGIRISDVSYQYYDSTRLVIKDFSHDFKPGSKTVIMGETGIGKSTIIRLILALLVPTKGKIEIYDKRRSVTVSAATRCNMVYVPQGNSLLEGTIRQNLLLGNPDATDAELREALHTAVADFVYELPDGLDTPCGELGAGLSEGQAQRIAIARALLRNGNVLLLDEFNSSLDEATAATLMERLYSQKADSTIIFISHRPDVMQYCDNILRLNEME